MAAGPLRVAHRAHPVKVAVGISGGVDSAVTALLLKERGFEVIGVTMALGRSGESAAIAEARAAAAHLGIEFRLFDLAAEWNSNVLSYLRETYLAGRTPNPCVRCNETVKFGLLPRLAFTSCGCEAFATGHYARVEGGRLFRGVDHAKDQSYFLYRVPADVLARTIFPLGGLTKSAVRAKAREFGLPVADKNDSQDFCGGNPMDIVGAADCPGNIVTVDGRVLGRHRGFWNYTVGKRKGLGIGGGTPYYVVRLNARRNEVVVGFREQAIVHSFEIASVVRFPGVADGPLDVFVKIRSAGEPKGPVRWNGSHVESVEGLVGVAPGQSAVFYRGDEIVGGGIIVG